MSFEAQRPTEGPKYPFNKRAQAAYEKLLEGKRRREALARESEMKTEREIDDALSIFSEPDPAAEIARLAEEEGEIAKAAIGRIQAAIRNGYVEKRGLDVNKGKEKSAPSNPFKGKSIVMEMPRATPSLTAKSIAVMAKNGGRTIFKDELEALREEGREDYVEETEKILPYEFAAVLNKEEKGRKPAELLEEIRLKYSEPYPGFFDALTDAFIKIRHNEIDDYDARTKLKELGEKNIYFEHDIQKISKIIADEPWKTVNEAMAELRKSGYTSDYFDLIGTAIEMAVTAPKSGSIRKGGPQSVRRSA